MRQCWCLPKKRRQRHFIARIPGGYGGKAKEYVTGRIINLSSIVGQGRQHRSDELGGVQVWPARVDHEHGAGGRLPAQTLPASSACIATEMVRAIPDKIRDNFCDKIPINGFGEQRRSAHVAHFLAADASSYSPARSERQEWTCKRSSIA